MREERGDRGGKLAGPVPLSENASDANAVIHELQDLVDKWLLRKSRLRPRVLSLVFDPA
jgi:hypothetical protein